MKRRSPNTSTSERQDRKANGAILTYLDVRSKRIISALSASRSYFAVEGIHDLRVEIKRLRALLKLIGQVAPSFAAKPNARRLRPLFSAAGRLRDIDICQELTLPKLRQLDLREYFNALKRDELRYRERFSSLAQDDAISQTLTRCRLEVRSALAAISAGRIRSRMDKRIAKQARRLAERAKRPRPHDDDLHTIRKKAKALRYDLDVWQQCFGSSAIATESAGLLKKMYGHLGEWRDTLVTMEGSDWFLKSRRREELGCARAYATFRADLRRQSRASIARYRAAARKLPRALGRLSDSMSGPRA